AEDVELRQRRHLFLQVDFLAVAQRPCRPSEGRYFLGLREDAHEVRHDTLLAYARPELLYASRITLVSRRTTQIRRLVLGIVGIVAGSHRGLVRHNINGAECAELLRDRCDVIVADEDVLDRKSTRLNSSHVAISYAVF